MNTKEFENKRWKEKKQTLVFRHRAALEMIIQGSRVLDLGCGDGLFLKMLKSRGIHGMGLDISEKAIQECRSKNLDAEVFDFTYKKLNFRDGEFDYVVILDVLEHLYFPLKVTKEATRVSAKYIIVSVPNFNSLPARMQVLLGKVPENNKSKKGHVYWFNLKELKKMFKEVNLSIKEVEINYFWANKFLISWLVKFLAKIRPQLFALSFVIKAEKKT